ncbi:MAG: DNA-3-methyladenine glycosylase [Planctomycetes bacterium]|jgi:DNA-3-methyladenine glycosylase|nr:DNA-3-methyladenine glycosylase [Planctomycetota bacterium]
MILLQSFYNRTALKVAQDLLGCFLVRRLNGMIIKAKIVETEAYNGLRDLASHASRGRTERNKVMFGPPGIFYVYFTYGLHHLLNIVTGRENYPAAVLIRALELSSPPPPLPRLLSRGRGEATKGSRGEGQGNSPANGPAKLTEYLAIDKEFNGLPCFVKKHGLWVESKNKKIKKSDIIMTKRIGVDYAGSYKDKKWRFYLRDNRFVSRK